MRVLALGAHPDDLEILCGARWPATSGRTRGRHVPRDEGDRGSFEHTSEEIARIRDCGGTARAAEICGAEHVSLGLSDGEVNAADRAAHARRRSRPRDAPGRDHHALAKRLHGRPQRDLEARVRRELPRDASRSSRPSILSTGRTPPSSTWNGHGPRLHADRVRRRVRDDREEGGDARAHESQLRWLKGPRRYRHRREHADCHGLPRVRSAGVKYAEAFAPCLAWLRRGRPAPAAIRRSLNGHRPGLRLLAGELHLVSRSRCVRAGARGSAAPSSPGIRTRTSGSRSSTRDEFYQAFATTSSAVYGTRATTGGSSCDPSRRADAAVRDRGADDQRRATVARARAHVQHGRVRRRGRRDRAALLAGLVPASDVGAVPRADRSGAAPARGADPLPDHRGRSPTTRADRGSWRRRRLLRRHRLVRAHRVLGVAPRRRVRRRPRAPTSRPARGSSSCIR